MDSNTQIAENHIQISRTLFDEGIRAVESKAYKKAIRKTALILAALYLAVAIWLFYTGGSLFFLLGESFFLGALLFWLTVMLPRTRRRSKYKALAQTSDHIPERTTRFYPDHLSVTTDSGKITVISSDDISGWQETPHLYLLNCSHNIYVLLDKKGFVTGDFSVIKSIFFKD